MKVRNMFVVKRTFVPSCILSVRILPQRKSSNFVLCFITGLAKVAAGGGGSGYLTLLMLVGNEGSSSVA